MKVGYIYIQLSYEDHIHTRRHFSSVNVLVILKTCLSVVRCYLDFSFIFFFLLFFLCLSCLFISWISTIVIVCIISYFSCSLHAQTNTEPLFASSTSLYFAIHVFLVFFFYDYYFPHFFIFSIVFVYNFVKYMSLILFNFGHAAV